MTDRETREKILKDQTLPIHRPYNGVYNRKDILELFLKGYGTMEITEELGINKQTVIDSAKRLRLELGYSSNRKMLRGLVVKHRGYL